MVLSNISFGDSKIPKNRLREVGEMKSSMCSLFVMGSGEGMLWS